MLMAVVVLVLSAGLFFFYLQIACQKTLRKQFPQDYFRLIVDLNRLEFLSIRKAIEDFGVSVDYPRLTAMLKCDFLALTYLVKNAVNVEQRNTYDERLLILYFKLAYVSLIGRHWLKLREASVVMKLTAILEYFANVVGERLQTASIRALTITDFLSGSGEFRESRPATKPLRS